MLIVYTIQNRRRCKMNQEVEFDKQDFQRKLRILRQYYGLSQKALADCLHIERSTYTSYEIGRSMPSLYMIKVMAEQLHVSSDFLLGVKSGKDQNIQEKMDRILEAFPDL